MWPVAHRAPTNIRRMAMPLDMRVRCGRLFRIRTGASSRMRPLTEKAPRHAHPSTFICMKEKHMSHRLTIKGQVTIPKEIRDFLGLEEGCSCVDSSLKPTAASACVRRAKSLVPVVPPALPPFKPCANPCTVFARAPMAAFSPCLRAVSDGITPVDVSVSAA